MDLKYTATVYNNNHVISSHVGDDLAQVTASLLLLLDDMVSGSYGTIKDNSRDVIVHHFCKRALVD